MNYWKRIKLKPNERETLGKKARNRFAFTSLFTNETELKELQNLGNYSYNYHKKSNTFVYIS